VAFPERVETERLVLRRWRERDRGAWLAIWSDPTVWRALRPDLGPDSPHALARFDHHLRHWSDHGFGLWALEDRASRTIGGWAGAAHPTFVPELAEEVEVGWTLRAPYRGRGLATEGAAAALAAAFEHLDVGRVVALVERSNRPSARVARRLGMRAGGTVHHPEAGVELELWAAAGPQ
jgi:RimJ/RimL family protein N-acetyltransferase